MAVNYIPEGYGTVTPYLIIRGAANAIEWYKKALGATEIMRMPGPDGSIMHAEVKVGNSPIMIGEECPERGAKSPQTLGGSSVGLHIYVPDCDAAFNQAVEAGATPTMPPMDMFWGDRFSKLSDPFGHEWSIATHVEDVSDAEMAKRAEEAAKQAAGSA
jgi:PhnB protein